MLGLPKSTVVNKQLPKKAIYAKFQMNTVAKEKIDADISKIMIVNEIVPNKVNIDSGENVKSFFVMLVSLKTKEFSEKTIAVLSKLIPQNMLFILEYETECKLVVLRSKLIQTEWIPTESAQIELKGLNLDAVWENIIVQIGSIRIGSGNTLDEQIAIDEQKVKLQKEIVRLEKLARAEKQPKKKFELVSQANVLKKQLAELDKKD
ncbi:DUF4391 domain-containing protein [Amedibacterium intestinale]|uniref:DUF4391 domain-containing protein n=1 Tax=Amedibacterium intestinale TaxID=2583452 RepID=A0A6N4THA7_9FIRM|nr:DUF4391 domain-containing protein [Amedibacterium intestinale]RHO29399.1 DUF4391 family protein [Erysipelotrichaceae bacterium AM17-60]BBK21961.1 hypothetical protein Aargi30884_08640 [Amedibacterium intestinale]